MKSRWNVPLDDVDVDGDDVYNGNGDNKEIHGFIQQL